MIAGITTTIPWEATTSDIVAHADQLKRQAAALHTRCPRIDDADNLVIIFEPSTDFKSEPIDDGSEPLSIAHLLKSGLDEGRDHPYTKIDGLESFGTGAESDVI